MYLLSNVPPVTFYSFRSYAQAIQSHTRPDLGKLELFRGRQKDVRDEPRLARDMGVCGVGPDGYASNKHREEIRMLTLFRLPDG